MSNPISVRALLSVACGVIAASALLACGGSEPPPQAPEPPHESHEETSSGASVSAEIGGLNEEKVDKTFQSALSNFQQCLDDGAKRVEFLGGSVSFFVKIDARG